MNWNKNRIGRVGVQKKWRMWNVVGLEGSEDTVKNVNIGFKKTYLLEGRRMAWKGLEGTI